MGGGFLKAMDLVRQLRQEGFCAYFTMDMALMSDSLSSKSSQAIRDRFMTEFDSKQWQWPMASLIN